MNNYEELKNLISVIKLKLIVDKVLLVSFRCTTVRMRHIFLYFSNFFLRATKEVRENFAGIIYLALTRRPSLNFEQ